jgi:phosphatidate phosphatase APP1
LIGDDGQHDQEIYSEFCSAHPQNVSAVAIRRLSPTQAVLAGSLPAPIEEAAGAGSAPVVAASGPAGKNWLCAPDGAGLWRLLRDTDVL